MSRKQKATDEQPEATAENPGAGSEQAPGIDPGNGVSSGGDAVADSSPAPEEREAQAEPNPTPVPSQAPDPIYSPEDMRIMKLVGDQSDPPRPSVERQALLEQLEFMSVPKAWMRAEFTYGWKDPETMQGELCSQGGIWQIVTRGNHSHMPTGVFAMNGAVNYEGMVLCYAHRDWKVRHQNKILNQYRAQEKADEKGHELKGHGGRVVARIEPTGESNLGGSYGANPGSPPVALPETDPQPMETYNAT